MPDRKLPRSFYARNDVALIAKELLGKILCTEFDGVFTSGKIVETEAYNGENDKACHSCVHGLTDRTKVMFGEPGFSYVYLCYGIHHLFNVVSNVENKADAILIRAIEPMDGVEEILRRRNKTKLHRSVGGGPGIASKALGITTKHYGVDLLGNEIWIEDRGITVSENQIISSPRVGVDYAGDDAKRPWRFRVKDNTYTSPAK